MTDREKLIELIEESYYCDIVSLAEDLVSKGVTVQQWISVKDMLPEANERVLICSELGNQYVAQHFGGHFYVDGTNIKTSHWMPLPQPPKGE